MVSNENHIICEFNIVPFPTPPLSLSLSLSVLKAYGNLLKAHLDGLKKREKKGTKSSAAGGTVKQKKGKATV